MLYEFFVLLKKENSINDSIKNLQQAILGNPTRRIFFGYLFVVIISSSFFTLTNLRANLTVSQSEQNAATWIQSNTPASATIATITQGRPLADPLTEWLPALTKRKVVTNNFGYEWTTGDVSFQKRLTAYQNLQYCAHKDADCIKKWIKENDQIGYIVLRMGGSEGYSEMPLRIFLLESHDFSQVYYKDNISIFKIESK